MNKNKGFTLIELLVVIAIIGILSSVVLASLNSARESGEDARIKANLANARAAAALYYDGDGNGSYTDVCSGTGPLGSFTSSLGLAYYETSCNPADGAWALSVELSDGASWFCVDSEGSATTTTGDPIPGFETSCI